MGFILTIKNKTKQQQKLPHRGKTGQLVWLKIVESKDVLRIKRFFILKIKTDKNRQIINFNMFNINMSIK